MVPIVGRGRLLGAARCANQSIDLKFAPQAFATTQLAQTAEERPVITPPLTSVFANYDVSYTHTATRGIPSVDDLGALTELGLLGRAGVLTNTSVVRNLAGDPPCRPGR